MSGLSGMPGGKGMMENVAKRFLRTQWAEGISELIAAVEHDLTASVEDLVAVTDADVDLDIPDADVRAKQLRAGVLAIIEGDLREHYIREHVSCAKPDRVVKLVQLADDDWQDRREGWVDAYHEEGVDKDTERIVEEHLVRNYRLHREEIEQFREWSDDMQSTAIRTVLVGNVEAAREAIQTVTAEVADGS